MSADLAVLVDDPGLIERSADPGEFLVAACERAKVWLREALDHGDIDRIAEMRAQAEAIRVYTMSKELGRDAELAATEIVRRAERGLGLCVRRAQAEGWMAASGQSAGNQYQQDQLGADNDDTSSKLILASPGDYVGDGGTRSDIYAMPDGLSDAEFDQAVAEARADGNLTRAGLLRKTRKTRARRAETSDTIPRGSDRSRDAAERRRVLIRKLAAEGRSSRQIADVLGITPHSVRAIARQNGTDITADRVMAGYTRIDTNRVIAETVGALEGMRTGIDLIDPDAIDPAQAADWAASIARSVRTLNALIRTLKEAAQ